MTFSTIASTANHESSNLPTQMDQDLDNQAALHSAAQEAVAIRSSNQAESTSASYRARQKMWKVLGINYTYVN